MNIKQPCIITARLLPGIKIGDSFLSIERDGISSDNRDIYRIYLDTPDFEYTSNDLQSGVGGGSLQSGLESCLGFMNACADAYSYKRWHKVPGDNDDLFPEHVAEWCYQNSDEIVMLECELQETPGLIEE